MDKPLVKIEYKTANGSRICVEVSTSVKELLEQSDRQIRSQKRQDRRYLDFTPLTDEYMENALLGAYEDTADLLDRMERDTRLHKTIGKLTEIQRRRLYLHFFRGLTYKQIAKVENVNCRAVAYSIKQALNALKKLGVN